MLMEMNIFIVNIYQYVQKYKIFKFNKKMDTYMY